MHTDEQGGVVVREPFHVINIQQRESYGGCISTQTRGRLCHLSEPHFLCHFRLRSEAKALDVAVPMSTLCIHGSLHTLKPSSATHRNPDPPGLDMVWRKGFCLGSWSLRWWR